MNTFTEWLENRVFFEGDSQHKRELEDLLKRNDFHIERNNKENWWVKDGVGVSVSIQSKIIPRKMFKTVMRDWLRNKAIEMAKRAKRELEKTY